MINFLYAGLFLIFFILFVIIISIRFKVACNSSGIKLTTKKAGEATLLSILINIIFPFKIAGVFVKPFFLKKIEKINYEKSISAVFVEQVFDNLPQIIIFLVSIYFYTQPTSSIAKNIMMLTVLLFVMFFIFYSKKATDFFDSVLKLIKYLPEKIKTFIQRKSPIKHKRILEVIQTIQKSPANNFNLFIMTVIAIIIAFHSPLIQYFFFKSLHIETTYLQMFIAYWIPFLIGRVSGVPSGFGVRDGAMIALLVSYGIDVKEAIFATVAFRIVITVFNAILGSTVILKYGIKLKEIRKNLTRD